MTTADIPAETVSSDDEWGLVYDWQCPACNLYCHLLCIRESGGQFRLVNARDNPEVMKEITARGFDVDQGMILKMNDQFCPQLERLSGVAGP